jgi:hypothetical protein
MSNQIADTACIFGAPPIDANTLADVLTRAAAPIILDAGLYAHTRLTWALDTTLRTLAEERGLTPYFKTMPFELLFDHVWLNGDRGIMLAAEHELRRTRNQERFITGDFRKLLYSKAPLKLFSYQTLAHGPESDDLRNLLAGILTGFTQHAANEEYVLFEMTQSNAWAYRYRVPATGEIAPATFAEVPGSPRAFVASPNAQLMPHIQAVPHRPLPVSLCAERQRRATPRLEGSQTAKQL